MEEFKGAEKNPNEEYVRTRKIFEKPYHSLKFEKHKEWFINCKREYDLKTIHPDFIQNVFHRPEKFFEILGDNEKEVFLLNLIKDPIYYMERFAFYGNIKANKFKEKAIHSLGKVGDEIRSLSFFEYDYKKALMVYNEFLLKSFNSFKELYSTKKESPEFKNKRSYYLYYLCLVDSLTEKIPEQKRGERISSWIKEEVKKIKENEDLGFAERMIVEEILTPTEEDRLYDKKGLQNHYKIKDFGNLRKSGFSLERLYDDKEYIDDPRRNPIEDWGKIGKDRKSLDFKRRNTERSSAVLYSSTGHPIFYFGRDMIHEKYIRDSLGYPVKENLSIADQSNYTIQNDYYRMSPNTDRAKNDILLNRGVRKRVENLFGFKYEDLNPVQQIAFLNNIFDKSSPEIGRLLSFLEDNESRIKRIKSISLFWDGKKSEEKIISIGEGLPQKQADTIFSKYAEISDMIYDLEDEIKESLKDPKDLKKVNIWKITSELLKNVRETPGKIQEKISRSDGDFSDILEGLEQFESDIIIYKNIIKSSRDLRLTDLEGINFTSQSIKDIKKNSPQDLEQMRQIYLENLQQAGKEERIGYLFDNLVNNDKETRFFILKKDDDVVSFFRFTDDNENSVFAGGFNIDQSWSGGQIGLKIAKETLNEEAENRTIKAHCDPLSPISSHYLGEMGFVAKDFDLEKFMLHIERNDKKNANYVSLNWSEDRVLEEFIKKDNDISDLEGLEILGLDLNDRVTIAKVLNNATKKLGYVITRMVRDQNKVYYVFEKEDKTFVIRTEEKAA